MLCYSAIRDFNERPFELIQNLSVTPSADGFIKQADRSIYLISKALLPSLYNQNINSLDTIMNDLKETGIVTDPRLLLLSH